jgi:hypothetical protein
MKGKDTTVEELIAALRKCPPDAVVRVDVDLCQQGPIIDMRVFKRRGLVVLDCSDDCSHGYGEK